MMTFSGSQGKTPWKQWNNFLEGKRGSNEGPINHNKLSICPLFCQTGAALNSMAFGLRYIEKNAAATTITDAS